MGAGYTGERDDNRQRREHDDLGVSRPSPLLELVNSITGLQAASEVGHWTITVTVEIERGSDMGIRVGDPRVCGMRLGILHAHWSYIYHWAILLPCGGYALIPVNSCSSDPLSMFCSSLIHVTFATTQAHNAPLALCTKCLHYEKLSFCSNAV